MNPRASLLVVNTNLWSTALFVGSAIARQILGRMLHEAMLCFCPATFAELQAKGRHRKFDRYIREEDRAKAVELRLAKARLLHRHRQSRQHLP